MPLKTFLIEYRRAEKPYPCIGFLVQFALFMIGLSARPLRLMYVFDFQELTNHLVKPRVLASKRVGFRG